MASENGRALRSRAAALLFVGVTLVCHESAASTPWPATVAVEAHGTGCEQTAYETRDARQEHTFTWVMNLDSVPPHLDPDRAERAIRQATATIVRSWTPCRLVGGDSSVPRAIYAGPTGRHANVTSDEECFPSGRSDGISVVSFGDLPDDVVAVTCTYSDRGDIWQSDVLLSDDPGVFTLDPHGTCADSYDLQAVMTHERGHSFGLGHVPETPGADELTMSSFMGRCDASARTLGVGDVLGLRQIY